MQGVAAVSFLIEKYPDVVDVTIARGCGPLDVGDFWCLWVSDDHVLIFPNMRAQLIDKAESSTNFG